MEKIINNMPLIRTRTLNVNGRPERVLDPESANQVLFLLWQSVFGISGRGANGAAFQGPINAGGNKVYGAVNSASPTPDEVITKAYADANYGAEAMRTQLGAQSGNPLLIDGAAPHVRLNLDYVPDTSDRAALASYAVTDGMVNRWGNLGLGGGTSGQLSGQNLLFNPLGSQSLNGWQNPSGNFSAADPRSAFSGRIQCNSAGTFQAYQAFTPLVNGTFTLACWLEINNNFAGQQIGIDIYEPGNSTVIAGKYAGAPGSYPIWINALLSAGVTYQARLYYSSSGAAGAYWYQPKLEVGSAPSAFSDDYTAGFLGTTHDPEGGIGIDGLLDGVDYNRTVAQMSNENLIQNGSALIGSAGETAPGWSGLAQIKSGIKLPGGQTGNVIYNPASVNYGGATYSSTFSMTPGATYQFDGEILTGGAGSWALYRGNYPDAGVVSVGAPTAWTPFSFQYTVPNNSTELNGQLLAINTKATSDWMYLSKVSAVLVRNLDTQVMDGTQYARIVAAALSSGKIANFLNGMVSGTSFPGSPTLGTVFYRTDQNRYYLYNGSAWIQVSLASLDELVDGSEYARFKAAGLASGTLSSFARGMQSGTSFPGSPADGAVFYRTDTTRFYMYDGSAWINVSTASLDELGDGTARYAVNNGPGVGGLSNVSGTGAAAVATTTSIQAAAVNESVTQVQTSFVSFAASTPTQLGNAASINTNGGYVKLSLTTTVEGPTSGSGGYSITLKNTTTGTTLLSDAYPAPATGTWQPFCAANIVDGSPAAGSNTYTATIEANYAGSAIPVMFTVENAKR